MDSKNQQFYQTASRQVQTSQVQTFQVSTSHELQSVCNSAVVVPKGEQNAKTMIEQSKKSADSSQRHTECSEVSDILKRIKGGRLMVVNGRRRNGLILYKRYHAEFAGPGAAVGGVFDEDCQYVIPVGDLSLLDPESHEERQKAYLIRRQWIRLTQQFTDKSVPLQRAQMILNQFEEYFDEETIAQIPDDAFALMVGVLPYTVKMVRLAST
jgi:hypothetical protein